MDIFEILEHDRKDLFVTMKELKKFFKNNWLAITDEELENFFDSIDPEHNGKLKIKEFNNFIQ